MSVMSVDRRFSIESLRRRVAGRVSCAVMLLMFVAALPALPAAAQTTTVYQQTNLVSDGYVPAAKTDPKLIDPWGVSIGQDLWINANGSGINLVDDIAGNTAFSVTIPPGSPKLMQSLPTGTVLNPDTANFMLPGSLKAIFLFATLDGTLSGWNPSSTTAVIAVNNNATGAGYTDIALDTNSNGTFLLAANFAQGKLEVYDSNFKPATLHGSFTDPNLPQNYVPYAIHVINGQVFITYAELNTSTGAEQLGVGNGLVDVYDTNGNFIQQAIAHGNLNAPWGMALAPSTFGTFAGDLLVGNFGDGVINVYDPKSFTFKGQVADGNGNPIANPGLWEIFFGQASPAVGDPGTLYFVAGLNNEKDGLYGSIASVAPSGSASFKLSSSATSLSVTAGGSGKLNVSVAPTNGFTGNVTFTCTGLPLGATCSFAPASVTVASGTSAATTLTVATSGAAASPGNGYGMNYRPALGALGTLAWALLILPAGTFGARNLKNRKSVAGLWMLLLISVAGFATGCGSYKAPAPSTPTGTVTPKGTSTVTVTAAAGSMAQSSTFMLTVN